MSIYAIALDIFNHLYRSIGCRRYRIANLLKNIQKRMCSSIKIKAVFVYVYLSNSSIASYCLKWRRITETHYYSLRWAPIAWDVLSETGNRLAYTRIFHIYWTIFRLRLAFIMFNSINQKKNVYYIVIILLGFSYNHNFWNITYN